MTTKVVAKPKSPAYYLVGGALHYLLITSPGSKRSPKPLIQVQPNYQPAPKAQLPTASSVVHPWDQRDEHLQSRVRHRRQMDRA
jgi:hypothetical protein